MNLARTYLYQKSARPGVPHYLILVTDGQSNDDVVKPSNLLKTEGVVIFAVGVGRGFNRNQLNIMSSDPDSRYTLTLSNFNSFNSIVKVIKDLLCKGQSKDIALHCHFQSFSMKPKSTLLQKEFKCLLVKTFQKRPAASS